MHTRTAQLISLMESVCDVPLISAVSLFIAVSVFLIDLFMITGLQTMMISITFPVQEEKAFFFKLSNKAD